MKDIDNLKIGESITIPGRGGWMIKLIKTAEGFDLVHFNPISNDENQLKFFKYTTIGDPYGAGKIDQEPTLGVTCQSCGVNIDSLVSGALITNENGDEIIERYSWSNLVLNQNKNFRITLGGELLIDGNQSKGYLRALFLADKNRIKGFVGVFSPKKPKEVQIMEMEDLILNSLK